MKKKVIIAISGGIDSSISALLLKQQGYEVEGIFMKNWQSDNFCSIKKDLNDAKIICKTIKIKLHIINFAEEYWNNVFSKSIIFDQGQILPNDWTCCMSGGRPRRSG